MPSVSEMTWDGKEERRRLPAACHQDILERLTRIEAELSRVAGVLTELRTMLCGNGRNGLVLKVDRLEQVVRISSCVLGTAWAAILSLLVRWVVG